jgi:hypothetical protein
MKTRPPTFVRLVSRISVVALLGVIVLASGASCAPSGFADPTIISTVRILASSADLPYAPPGAEVNLQVLAYDGRTSKPEPMVIYWLPFVCENPADDAYYNCFQQIEGGGRGGPSSGSTDAGAGDGGSSGGGFVGAGGVLNLPTGSSYSFRMPDDAVTSHASEPGTAVPYGLAILFNIACAGHLQLVSVDPSDQNPQALPIGCFDSSGNQLGADDWVFGFTRVYAYDTLTTPNPVVSYVDVGGKKLQVTPQAGVPQIYTTPACDSRTGCLAMPHCTGDGSDCQVQFGPVVPASSWVVNPESTDINGNPLHAEIWVDYYATFGQLGDEARLLYDSTTGSIGGPSTTDTLFQSPSTASTGNIWMVVHDDLGGTSWVTMPVRIE